LTSLVFPGTRPVRRGTPSAVPRPGKSVDFFLSSVFSEKIFEKYNSESLKRCVSLSSIRDNRNIGRDEQPVGEGNGGTECKMYMRYALDTM
jgi:hypothetical protein